jgi:hypothetical protein
LKHNVITGFGLSSEQPSAFYGGVESDLKDGKQKVSRSVYFGPGGGTINGVWWEARDFSTDYRTAGFELRTDNSVHFYVEGIKVGQIKMAKNAPSIQPSYIKISTSLGQNTEMKFLKKDQRVSVDYIAYYR